MVIQVNFQFNVSFNSSGDLFQEGYRVYYFYSIRSKRESSINLSWFRSPVSLFDYGCAKFNPHHFGSKFTSLVFH